MGDKYQIFVIQKFRVSNFGYSVFEKLYEETIGKETGGETYSEDQWKLKLTIWILYLGEGEEDIVLLWLGREK